MNHDTETCGARRPGWENGPAIGRNRIPCVLPADHAEGEHRNAFGDTWPVASLLELEIAATMRALDALYARVRAGDDSAHLRQRIARWEALQAALMGDPGALSA